MKMFSSTKTAIIAATFIAVTSTCSFSFARERQFQEMTRNLPNLLCQYVYADNQWTSRGPFISKFGVDGKVFFGNVWASFSDPEAPGSGICMARERNEAGNVASFKMLTYDFEKKFAAMPGTCEVDTEGPYRVVEQLQVTPEPGQVTKLTVHRSNGTKLHYVNYFLTEADEQAWMTDDKLPFAKCEALAPTKPD